MNVGSTSVDRAPALQAGLLSCDATCGANALQVDERRANVQVWPGSRAFAVYQIAHGHGRFGAERCKPLHDGGAGALGLILTDLPLTFEALNLHFEADDPFEERGDELLRGVADAPGGGLGGFVRVYKGVEVGEKPLGIFDEPKWTVSVDDGVVPSGNDLAGLGLLRIPTGCDVVLGAGEDGQRLNVRREVAPLTIGAGEVCSQDGVVVAFAVKEHGEVRGEEAGASHGDERGQRLGAHEAIEDIDAGLFVVPGNIHRCAPS